MSRIALIGKSSVNYISLLLDIWNNGDCAVLIDWQTPFYTAIEMMRDAGVTSCYVQAGIWDKYDLNAFSEIEMQHFSIDNAMTFELPTCIYDKFHANYNHSEAVVIYSSGTTGKSKGVILSHFAINTNADAIIGYMNPSPSNDSIYTVRPLSHSSTLTGKLLVALKSRTKLIIATSAILPRRILSEMKQHDVTILCLNPTLLSFLCDEAERKHYDLSVLERIYVSGAILNDHVYEKAKKS